jgi:hypothetical protein
MGTNFSASHSALAILPPLHSYGVSIVSIKQLMMTLDFPLYSQVPSNISMLMVVKMSKILLECSRQETGLKSGFSIILDQIQALHFVLQEVYLTLKKSLLPSIQVLVSLLSTLGLL